MASVSYILMGQQYLDTTAAYADLWTTDREGVRYAKLTEVNALLPEQEEKRTYQLVLTEEETYLLGSLFSLGHATIKGDVDSQGFFIQATVLLIVKHQSAYESLGRKMLNVARTLV